MEEGLFIYSLLPAAIPPSSKHDTWNFFNQSIKGYIINIQVSLTYLRIILHPVLYYLIVLTYFTISSICNELHGFSYAILSCVRCP